MKRSTYASGASGAPESNDNEQPTALWLSVRSRRLVGAGLVLVIVLLGVRWYTGTAHTPIVTGTQVLAPDSVVARVHVDPEQPLRSIDTETVTHQIEHHPWIKTATVRAQRFRNRLALHIEERTPVGRVVDDAGQLDFYLDAYGYAMPPRADTTFDAPSVHDETLTYQEVDAVANDDLQAMLQALAQSEMTADKISEVHVDPNHTIHLYVTHPSGHSVAVRFGENEYSKKLRHLEMFYDHVLESTTDSIGTIDLRFREQIVTQP